MTWRMRIINKMKNNNTNKRKCLVCDKPLFRLDPQNVYTRNKKYCDGCKIRYGSRCRFLAKKRND